MNELVERLRDLLDVLAEQGREDAAEAVQQAIAALQCNAEPVAWMLRRKDNGFIRGCYSTKPSEESLQIAAIDGDEYVPLYTSPQAAQAIPDGWKVADHGDYVAVQSKDGSGCVAEDMTGDPNRIPEHMLARLARALLATSQDKGGERG